MSEAIWNNSTAFWLLWVLPLLIGTAIWAHQQVRRAAQQFAGQVMTPRLLPPLHVQGPLQKTALLAAGLALSVVAAAGPAWGVFYRPAVARGLDLVVVLDVSRSMLADDAGDTRLGRARSAIAWLADQLAGDRVGLLLFAGQNVQTCPLTLDRGFFHSALEAAGPALVGRGGTKIGPALDEALRMLDTSWDRDKLVLLVTDGGDQESFPKTAADRLREKKVRVITLGLGRAEAGAPLIVDGKIVRQKDGQPVSARLNDTLLRELAVTTNGMYVPPEAAHRLPDLYSEHFGSARRGQNQEVQEKLHREQYQWFLVAGFVLLLLQAGATTYPRRRATGTGAPLAALALIGLALLGSCSRAHTAIESAIEQLQSGDAESAEKSLLALRDEFRDEPVLAYDLACAHQARSRPSEARARYVEALDRGDRKLRARTHVNLAMLAAQKLANLGGKDPGALEGGAREEVTKVADGALDDLQRARDLDPDLDDVARRQDLLARWLRVVQDAWRTHDRDHEREARTKLQGAAYLGAIAAAEADLIRRLGGDEVLEDVELRQRDLAEDLGKTKEHFTDQGAELTEAFRDGVGKGVDTLATELGSIASMLREGRVEEAIAVIGAASEDIIALWLLWADPGEGLQRAAQQQASFVDELAQFTLSRSRGKTVEPDQLEIAKRARERLSARARRTVTWLSNLQKRLAVEPADPKWSSICVDRARARLPDIETQIRDAAASLSSTGPKALVLSSRAAQALASLALEWQISQLDLGALCDRLEQEQVRIMRGADALLDPKAATGGLLQQIGRLAGDFARSLAWSPLRSDQDDQLARADHLEPALEKSLAKDKPQKPDAEAEQAQAARRTQSMAQIGAVRQALGRAAKASATGPDAAATLAMQEARIALRGLGLALSDFEASLARAAREQGALAGQGEQVATLDGAHAKPTPLQQVQRDARREQDVTSRLITILGSSLAAETAALEKPAVTAEQGKPAPSAADEEERKARLTAMNALRELLGPAAEAAKEALEDLGDDDVAENEIQAHFVRAAPLQRRAADLLARAQKQLEDARLPLAELASRVVDGESRLLHIARELRADRKVAGDDGKPLAWTDVHAAQSEIGSYVARMPRALQRELEQAHAAQQQQPAGAQTQPPAPPPAKPEDESEGEKELRSLVDGVVGTHRASLDALDGKDPAHDVATVETVLGLGSDLWTTLGEFQKVLERAVDEEADLLARSRQFATTAPTSDRATDASADQARTERKVLPLIQKLAVLEQRAQQQQAQQKQQPTQPPHQAGQAGAPAPGGLSPEVIELAKRNLPAAEIAMKDAEGHLDGKRWNDSGDRQEEAHRLLKEILDKLKQDQQQQKQQQQQQQQPQEQDAQPPPSMSQDELARLLEAVRERNQRENKPATRTPVQEDW